MSIEHVIGLCAVVGSCASAFGFVIGARMQDAYWAMHSGNSSVFYRGKFYRVDPERPDDA